MKTPHFEGLIFDCDGTLADTMPLHWRAWHMVTQRHGLHFPEDRFYSLGGVPARDIFKLLAQEQGRSLDHIAVAHEKEETYLPTLSQVEPIHAVVEIAKANHGKIPMAVASGGTEKIIGMVLDHLKIRHLFDAIVTSEMVKNQKPAPDIFLEAARRIGVEPKFCRAYEDTELGMTGHSRGGNGSGGRAGTDRQALKPVRFAAYPRIRWRAMVWSFAFRRPRNGVCPNRVNAELQT